tara:strand:+ start:488 stop:634 length:147 start_codon:yes stop_codon:yes gene_type:complete
MKKYQIGLSLIDGVGDIVWKKLLAQFGSAKEVFFAKRYSKAVAWLQNF